MATALCTTTEASPLKPQNGDNNRRRNAPSPSNAQHDKQIVENELKFLQPFYHFFLLLIFHSFAPTIPVRPPLFFETDDHLLCYYCATKPTEDFTCRSSYKEIGTLLKANITHTQKSHFKPYQQTCADRVEGGKKMKLLFRGQGCGNGKRHSSGPASDVSAASCRHLPGRNSALHHSAHFTMHRLTKGRKPPDIRVYLKRHRVQHGNS